MSEIVPMHSNVADIGPYMETVGQFRSVERGVFYSLERIEADGQIVLRQTIYGELYADIAMHAHDIPKLRAALARIEQPMIAPEPPLDIEVMRAALIEAGATFYRYADYHEAKGAYEKAAANRKLAIMCMAGLEGTRP